MKYRVGSIIEYKPFGGGKRVVLVEEKEADIKNGRPGFSGDLAATDSGPYSSVWGYDDQITKVVRY